MSEPAETPKIYTLLQVSRSIQKTIADRYTSAFWVKAEMNKLNYYSHSGHCYPELVEKQYNKVIAQLKSILWKTDYQRINQKFLEILQEPLKDGIKILFLATVTYDPTYGLSLRILDIDPSYTLGDLEKEKQDTIKRLHAEGTYLSNKKRPMPLLPQRIAIISVETSKGYADFLKIIDENQWQYKFFHLLFPALLQGEKAVSSIIQQLERIRQVMHHFDVVAIIRGGGGDVGLSCYNHYELAKAVALFPLPVITGIGHVTNETVVEMISYSNGITPTKIGEDLLQKFHSFAVPVQEGERKIKDKSRRLLSELKTAFHTEVKNFRKATDNLLHQNHAFIRNHAQHLHQQSKFQFRNHSQKIDYIKISLIKDCAALFGHRKNEIKYTIQEAKKEMVAQISHNHSGLTQLATGMMVHSKTVMVKKGHELIVQRTQLNNSTTQHFKTLQTDLQSLERNIAILHPNNVLKRGYSITLKDGKAVKSIQKTLPGERLTTIVYDGTIHSIVEDTNENAKP